tara:strand:+ start:112420 stop:113115 length:696 start_codon:yes stop_codon:yes gene_type:complete
MTHSVLLIEDSKEIYNLVNTSLSTPLIQLEWAANAKEASDKYTSNQYDLILIDIELPDGNGIEICNQILNKNPETSIFFLTAKDDLSEKVLGFSAGAEDYITKPFNGLELKARVEAKLKKLEILKQAKNEMKWKEIAINQATQEVSINMEGDNKDIDLTALEFKLLIYFAQRPYEVINRDTILNDIWGEDVHVYSRSVDTHVSKLRKKLAEASHLIESVHGAGYKFNPTTL